VIGAGQLSLRFTIEAPLGGHHAEPGDLLRFAPAGVLWAQAVEIAGHDDGARFAPSVHQRWRLLVRAPSTLKPGWRLRDQDRVLVVHACLPAAAGFEHIQCSLLDS
jgi:head-tail adaptor